MAELGPYPGGTLLLMLAELPRPWNLAGEWETNSRTFCPAEFMVPLLHSIVSTVGAKVGFGRAVQLL